ncbi:MAG: RsmB/NOP family class I SAM-dependent RNA methyltransferase [Gammaproteobacteria bacterium]|nr:MAG: RsmB/NOP family class I SAM-dependent RNA methyltransferase [Gammaproteobacteria bacterium]
MSAPLLPDDFLASLNSWLEPDAVARVVEAMSLEKPVCVRLNHKRWQKHDLLAWSEARQLMPQPLGWYEGAWLFPAEARETLTHSEAFAEGRFYIQNPSSLLPVHLLDPQPGETILDLAAAPGGKTLAIADRMGNSGQISAVEAVKTRFFALRRNLEAHGADSVRTYLMDGREAGRKVPERFDRVLLDAPCSSEARLVPGQPDTWVHWNLRKVRECQRKQVGLLKSALRTLKPGGRLVYSTCSFSAEENEVVLNKVLKRFDETVTIVPVQVPVANVHPGLVNHAGKALNPELSRAVRVLPDAVMDGFFVCVLEKRFP